MIWGIEARHSWFPSNGSGVLRTNLVQTPNPDVAIGKWSGVGAFFINPATVTRDTVVTPPLKLPACVKVVCTGAAVFEGTDIAIGNVVKGTTYKVSVYVRGATGAEVGRVMVGAAATGQAVTEFKTLPIGFTRIFVTFTATESGAARLAVGGPNEKKAQTFYVAAGLVEATSIYRPYFPTPIQLATKRAAFTGTSYESSSTVELPAVTLGLLTDDANVQVWPRHTIKTISGLHSIGEPENRADLPVRRMGEIGRLSYRRGKTVSYEGWIKAKTLRSLREAEAAFRAAFADEGAEGRMYVTPHPLNPDWSGVPQKFYVARSLGAEVVDSQDTENYKRRYLVALRLHDPRYFDEETEIHTATTAESLTSYSFV